MSSVSHPLVSVVMPVFNGEKYLREAIDSILNQTLKDFELIIIDDGSTDGTLKKIQKIQDSRIVIHCQENMGQALARNAGIALARGKYIAMMDADDISLPERFEKQVGYLEGHRSAAVVSAHVQMIVKGRNSDTDWEADIMTDTPAKVTRTLPRENCVVHAASFFKANIIKQYQYRHIKAAEDYDLFMRIASDGLKIHKIPEKLYFYRIHENSTLGKLSSVPTEVRMLHVHWKFLTYQLAQGKFSLFERRVLHSILREARYATVYYCKLLIRNLLSKIRRWNKT
jgi:glycosyltransferase involved in cell wall biosynthesis